jgi:hypothetical protein
MILRQPARDVIGKERRECCTRDAGHIRLLECNQIRARAAKLSNFLRYLGQQFIGEMQYFRIRRVGAKKQQRLVKTDERAGVGEWCSAPLPQQTGKSLVSIRPECAFGPFQAIQFHRE